MKGHLDDLAKLEFKQGDALKRAVKASTTDKLLVLATNGKVFTLPADQLPGGRGHGEPVRLMIELGNEQDIVALLVHKPGRRLVVAASDGRGFVVKEEDVIAQTRTGKQVLNVKDKTEAAACRPVEEGADHIAIIGENRKMIIFPLSELPEMGRGRGVTLQRYKDGGLSDVKSFKLKEGLTWVLGDRTRTETELRDWIGKRGQAGRLPPQGFPKGNKFE